MSPVLKSQFGAEQGKLYEAILTSSTWVSRISCIIAHSEVVDHLKKQLFHLDNFIGHKMINDWNRQITELGLSYGIG